ncbi:MAG: terminase TerL endonuclease subunit [Oscillospiraceae bacterium]
MMMKKTNSKTTPKFKTPLHEYIWRIDNGKVVAGEYLKKEMERNKRYLEDDRYELDIKECRKAIFFISNFCLLLESDDPKLIGKPITLSLWQKAFICSLVGFYHYVDEEKVDPDTLELLGSQKARTRMTREIFLMVASGNGKTTLLAAIAIYLMFGMDLYAPKAFIGSNAKEQSKLCFDYIKNMVEKNPQLNKMVRMQISQLRMQTKHNNGEISAMAGERSSLAKEGINPSILILDEVHGMKEDEFISQLKKNIKRDNFIIEITTQGTLRGKYLDRRLEYLREVLDGEYEDDTTRIWLYEQDSLEELVDPDSFVINCRKSSPQAGLTVKISKLRNLFESAMSDRTKTASILTKSFNIPQNSTEAWLSFDDCIVNNYDYKILKGTKGFLGLDMSLTTDLSCVTYMTEINGNDYIKQWFYMPKDLVEKNSKEDKIDYQWYIDKGYLFALEGSYIEQHKIELEMERIVKETGIVILRVGADPNRADRIIYNFRTKYGKNFVDAIYNKNRKLITPLINTLSRKFSNREIYFNNKLLEIHLGAIIKDEDKDGGILLRKYKQRSRIDGGDSLVYAYKAKELFELGYKGGGSGGFTIED